MATPSPAAPAAPPWFVAADIDGFFGLFFSGLPDLLLIAALCPLCGLPQELVTHTILPGIALSIVGGNLFYAWQARQLAIRTGRSDVTAIPFGVNAPTIFAYIFLIMLPVYRRTHDPTLAWHMGVFACFLSGVIQTAGAFCTDWIRRTVPAAATLSPLAGAALAFLCMGFVLQIFAVPQLALVPSFIILAAYAARLRLPFRFPVVGLAILVGVVLYAVLRHTHAAGLPEAPPLVAPTLNWPHLVNLFAFLGQGGWQYFSIIFPLALVDTLAAVQILESVRLAGDNYPTRPSLLANGLATLGASFFGSAFPTSLYFGHMAHKASGARIGYCVLNAAVTACLCLFGLVAVVLHFVPYQLVAFMIVWFGLLMVGQAFHESGPRQGAAVAIGLIPLLCTWGLQLVDTSLQSAGTSLFAAYGRFGSDLPLGGLIALSQGAFLTSMIWAACCSYLLQQRFLPAALWLGIAALFSYFGLIHAFVLTPDGVQNRLGPGASPAFAGSYALAALLMVAGHLYQKHAAHPFVAELVPNAEHD